MPKLLLPRNQCTCWFAPAVYFWGQRSHGDVTWLDFRSRLTDHQWLLLAVTVSDNGRQLPAGKWYSTTGSPLYRYCGMTHWILDKLIFNLVAACRGNGAANGGASEHCGLQDLIVHCDPKFQCCSWNSICLSSIISLHLLSLLNIDHLLLLLLLLLCCLCM